MPPFILLVSSLLSSNYNPQLVLSASELGYSYGLSLKGIPGDSSEAKLATFLGSGGGNVIDSTHRDLGVNGKLSLTYYYRMHACTKV